MRIFGAIIAVLAALATPASADDKWPERQVTIIVPFAAGGTTDLFGRMLASYLNTKYGKPVVVENRAGAGGNIGTTAAAKAPADGYTILIGTTSSFGINPTLYASLPHDTDKDFQPISLIARVPNLLVVSNKLPIKTMPELVAYMKANPDKLSYGSSGIGTSQHLGTELLLTMSGTKATHVPYRASNETMNALIGGHIDIALDNITLVLPQVKSGAVRPIGMSTLEPSPSAPEIPPIAATLPGFEASAWHGVFVHANVPPSIAKKLNADLREFLALDDTKKKFFEVGAVPAPMSPEEFKAFLTEERKKWEAVVKAAGVKVN
ncbi:MAG: tripartite tricarboxylate transporter substrate binding protein [Pseudolabrys sp.]|nr:tripartite tricarboxylate transporter substrate binding protein [Pseudolabrys sp.]MBV9955177.1 tripartite tricarboxylate transporter substrate binding protein [Pseudolabrys sp.]